jgi:CD109 antigen
MFDEKVGEASTTFKMPESITTFEFFGVSMNDRYGLGLSEKPASVRVFQDFFIQLSLPYSCKRSEVLALNILVFSYLNRNQSVTLSVGRSDSNYAVVDASLNRWTSEFFFGKFDNA